MNAIGQFRSFGFSMLLTVGLVACDVAPGPAERAGKQIDQEVNEAGKQLGQTADKFDKALNKQSAKAAEAVDDTEITARVKAAVLAEPGLKTLQISVDTTKGVVTLNGSVDSPQDGDRAYALASAVPGVRGVNNRLRSKSK